ncbi:MAG TPA: cupin domain-containing protein [Anaerolineales bacterium]|jgi:quercetin dioxygenase-like cupin family protein|nr:cupin domain-containing protein [Anaerolineales bacterium]
MKEPMIVTGNQDDNHSPISAIGESFDIYEWSGSGPEYLHVHHSDDEAWHVLEGTLTFKFHDKVVDASAGTTVFVPAGVPHSYYEAHGPTRYLIILTPRLRELISALHAAPIKEHKEIMRRFNSEILE